MRYPWGFDEEDSGCRKLKIELAQQIMALRQGGVSQFLVACDCGVGLYAGEIINGLRAVDSDLMLICYTPHEEQATKWAPYLRERYFTMLEKCTHISVVCPVGTPDAQLQAYRKIICLADVSNGQWGKQSLCFCCGKPYAHAGLASESADRRVGRRAVLSQTVLITG